HRTTGDDPGTCGRGTHEHLASAVAAVGVMMQRPALTQGDADHLPLGLLGRLADRLGHLAGLALAEADAALLVADDDECCKAEALAALHRLRHAVDRNQPVLEFRVLVTIATIPAAATSRFSCHVLTP